MERIKRFMAILVLLVLFALAASVKLGYTEVGIYEVEKVERIWNIGAKERGYYTDDCYYMVYTDGGAFRIDMTGVNAYAYGAGLIKAGRTYVLKTRGARVEMYGLYPNIINAEEYGN